MKLLIKGAQPQEPTLELSLEGAKYNDEQVNLSARHNGGTSVNHLAWITPKGEFYLNRDAITRVGLTIKNYT